MKLAKSSPDGWKTVWEKEKLLVTSNFSFFYSVCNRLVLQTSKNKGLFGKRVKTKDLENETANNILMLCTVGPARVAQ